MNERRAKVIASKGNRHVAVDVENWDEIHDFIQRSPAYTKKFKQIVGIILDRLNVPDLYDKEDIDEDCADVTAMKFFKNGKGNTANGRLYCKEVYEDNKTFIVIVCEVLTKKKNQKVKAEERNLIQKVAKHQFIIQYGEQENE